MENKDHTKRGVAYLAIAAFIWGTSFVAQSVGGKAFGAYTLQIAGQKYVNPTIACLLMSLESVFAALAGWHLLGEHLTARELAGSLLILIAVILAQVSLPSKKGIGSMDVS